ncbi:MAG TPA: 4-(cytidine 5'-diphospho)-2-C-methyl-D-erythritol kinase [Bacteroidia bacterium]|nr:4-(cytidine 5'-diphospho)-2-C-methyl-D-erythritol kinase [Bacteroidia bacterium]
MIYFPNAKINIGLNIVKKRNDGYHDIESVMYPLTDIAFDALEIIESKKTGIILSGIDVPGNTQDNLCLKAYHLISKDYTLPSIQIHLHKAIPVGAGLGGGSSDAAFFIQLLNKKFSLNISWGEMHHYAKQLGSDCSFFVSNQPAFVKGKGDEFDFIKLNLGGYYIVLVYPPIHINTGKAYSGVIPKKPKRSLKKDLLNCPIDEWKKYIHNDFEDSIFVEYPELKKIKKDLYSLGAVYSSMSGSGSTIYGIFKNLPLTKNKFKNCLIKTGKFI